MQKVWLALFLLALFSPLSQADDRLSTLGVVIDAANADTEPPAGGVTEKHWPRVGFEYTRTVWPRLDIFGGAGYHRIRVANNAGIFPGFRFFDYRVGARQYFSARQLNGKSYFIDASVSEGWLQDSASTTGGNRRYGGWNAAFGVAKLFSENVDMRVALGYSRMVAKVPQTFSTDVLSTVDLRMTFASRF